MNTKLTPPLMGKLPRQRLSIGLPAFTNTGIDYFEPLMIKLNKQTRKTCATAKRYGAVFTCLTTWAVHLELIRNLSTDNFILELRRFISQRGYPLEIFSDNGTNFIGGERELRDAISELDQNKIYKELTAKRIKWNFSPPASLWMKGRWKLLLRSQKKC